MVTQLTLGAFPLHGRLHGATVSRAFFCILSESDASASSFAATVLPRTRPRVQGWHFLASLSVRPKRSSSITARCSRISRSRPWATGPSSTGGGNSTESGVHLKQTDTDVGWTVRVENALQGSVGRPPMLQRQRGCSYDMMCTASEIAQSG